MEEKSNLNYSSLVKGKVIDYNLELKYKGCCKATFVTLKDLRLHLSQCEVAIIYDLEREREKIAKSKQGRVHMKQCN